MITIPLACPHCKTRIMHLGDHFRDAGNVAECPPHACPVLFRLRNRGA